MTDEEPEQVRKCFLGGLNFETTEEDLREYFGKYGEITDAVVIRDKITKKSRGFGFVTFKTLASTDQVIQDGRDNAKPGAKSGHTIRGRDIECKRAISREDSENDNMKQPNKKIFLGGIGESIEEDDLKNYFSQYGKVESVVIPTDKEKKSRRGFAFVIFDNTDDVDKICAFKTHTINGKKVEAKKAVPQNQMDRGGRGGGRDGGWGGGGFYDGDMGGFGRGDRFGGGGGGGNRFGGGGGRYGGGGGGYGGGGGGYGGGGYGGGSSGGYGGGNNYSQGSNFGGGGGDGYGNGGSYGGGGGYNQGGGGSYGGGGYGGNSGGGYGGGGNNFNSDNFGSNYGGSNSNFGPAKSGGYGGGRGQGPYQSSYGGSGGYGGGSGGGGGGMRRF